MLVLSVASPFSLNVVSRGNNMTQSDVIMLKGHKQSNAGLFCACRLVGPLLAILKL